MDNQKHLEDEFFDLLSAYMGRNASSEERERLKYLIELNPTFKILYDLMSRKPATIPYTQIRAAYLANCAKRFQSKSNKNNHHISYEEIVSRNQTKKYLGIAITLCAIIIVFLAYPYVSNWFTKPQQILQPHQYTTKKGSKSKLLLPDGSAVILNANSKLSYGSDFNRKNRTVHLSGEGYFQVTKNKSLPFIVQTNKATIKVLGTVFDVKSYPNEALFETSLLEGNIEITPLSNPERTISMKPLQKLIIRGDTMNDQQQNQSSFHSADKIFVQLTSITKSSNVVAETSWVEDKIVFDNNSLEEITKKMETKFNIKTVFLDDQPKHYRYTGVFQDGSLVEILNILTLSKEFQYRIEDSILIINK